MTTGWGSAWEREVKARAINATDWQPMPGMVKKRCSRCHYWFVVQAEEAGVTSRCPDCVGLGTRPARNNSTPNYRGGADQPDASIEQRRGPGFGDSPRQTDFDTMYDLIHLYRELLDGLPGEAALIGFSFGGWIAGEIAAAGSPKIDRLVLVDPVGIKIGGREERDIVHFFNTAPEELNRRSWHDPARRPPGCWGLGWQAAIDDAISDDDMIVLARNWDALCLYAWRPHMYNPQLKHWLHRISVPTLVLWGASDRIVTPAYGRAYADLIPGARFEGAAFSASSTAGMNRRVLRRPAAIDPSVPPRGMCTGQIEHARDGQPDRLGEELCGRQIERPGTLYQLAGNGDGHCSMTFPVELYLRTSTAFLGVVKRGFPMVPFTDDPPEVLELMKRVTIIPSHEMTLFGPRITIFTKDGKSYTKQATGREFIWDFNEEARRIRAIAPGIPIPTPQYEQIIETCRDLDQQSRAARLVELTLKKS